MVVWQRETLIQITGHMRYVWAVLMFCTPNKPSEHPRTQDTNRKTKVNYLQTKKMFATSCHVDRTLMVPRF